ncbi:L-threonylcarbamoyladenylate synthase [Paracoccus lutimaris]|uniref:Threonylcarbamoyl-AMP synthase n=1 Tax=Paracoccus lutimaris TaxID=1490030 RepID=A0A368YCT0_9RHOB|nr:L-threonylcarbamoyladenylate synthase [Paracoccus lutimaris]RCW77955.1 translation factor SUA5 [Paracoccus lutimaris]
MTVPVQARVLAADDPAALDAAIELLARGDLVAIPTETVYGLAGASTRADAISRIYQAKGRPSHNPLISHVADIAMAERYVRFDPRSRALAEAFWPGPLTLVLPLLPGPGIDRASTAGGTTAAVRAPRGFAHELIARLGLPLAVPSANRSGRISPTHAEHVLADLGDRLPLIVDGGPTEIGVESTVVRVRPDGIDILRAGVITPDQIALAAGFDLHDVAASLGDGGVLISPGMLSSHYAPRARVRLNAHEVAPGEALITFAAKRLPGQERAALVLDLSPSGDLAEAARELFGLLHRADASGADSIAVAPIPDHGIGTAIIDRLTRAAAPRDQGGRGSA